MMCYTIYNYGKNDEFKNLLDDKIHDVKLAEVVELADTQDSGSCGRIAHAGSSPALGTNYSF